MAYVTRNSGEVPGGFWTKAPSLFYVLDITLMVLKAAKQGRTLPLTSQTDRPRALLPCPAWVPGLETEN
ncbi:hypothetical protein [Deinococcus ruber]|uniref:Uncharacterized protein n=1 Tax=Deinococcus ruber TaxID=1848197 RepID=A0A918CFN2_9DEIO|nr:hypothetical protein [Deinococcus ruber]GGR19976.1 hypothetical protein GCM10008957_35470 [Deinococcus ruber]